MGTNAFFVLIPISGKLFLPLILRKLEAIFTENPYFHVLDSEI